MQRTFFPPLTGEGGSFPLPIGPVDGTRVVGCSGPRKPCFTFVHGSLDLWVPGPLTVFYAAKREKGGFRGVIPFSSPLHARVPFQPLRRDGNGPPSKGPQAMCPSQATLDAAVAPFPRRSSEDHPPSNRQRGSGQTKVMTPCGTSRHGSIWGGAPSGGRSRDPAAASSTPPTTSSAAPGAQPPILTPWRRS